MQVELPMEAGLTDTDHNGDAARSLALLDNRGERGCTWKLCSRNPILKYYVLPV